MKELDSLINDAYELFSGNTITEELDVCTACCLTSEEVNSLKTLKVKNISLKLLTEYQNAAKPNKLKINELKYFTPKYLEILKNYDYPAIEPELSLTRFGYFESSDWTSVEWKLLNNFAKLYFVRHLNLDIDAVYYISTLEILNMFYKGNFDINILLKEWELQSSNESIFCFNEIFEDIDFDDIENPKIDNAFFEKEFNSIIFNWIFSNSVKIKFRKEFENILNDTNPFWENLEKGTLLKNYEILNKTTHNNG